MSETPATADHDDLGADAHGKPELRLWLRLLACSNLIESEIRSRLRESFAVTLPRFDLMAQLDRAPDGLTMSELSNRLMVSNGNVTGVAERLVEDGLVARTPSPADRRSSILRLTEKGRATFHALAREHQQWIVDFFAGLDRREVEQLMELLGRAKRSVRASIEEG